MLLKDFFDFFGYLVLQSRSIWAILVVGLRLVGTLVWNYFNLGQWSFKVNSLHTPDKDCQRLITNRLCSGELKIR